MCKVDYFLSEDSFQEVTVRLRHMGDKLSKILRKRNFSPESIEVRVSSPSRTSSAKLEGFALLRYEGTDTLLTIPILEAYASVGSFLLSTIDRV